MCVWEQITKEELERLFCKENLSDAEIAQKYGVTKNQVRYKRRKFGITLASQLYQEFMDENAETYAILNKHAKERLLQSGQMDSFAKALTHYIFRNGPVEDMHCSGKLSEEDMKTLNQFMVNRIAGVLLYIREEKWMQLELVYSHYCRYGQHWDAAQPDTKIFELAWENMLDKIKNNAL